MFEYIESVIANNHLTNVAEEKIIMVNSDGGSAQSSDQKTWFQAGLEDLKDQWLVLVFFLLSTAGCTWMSFHSTHLPKVSIAWIFAAIICCQASTDFIKFSSIKSKSFFTATLRLLSGALAVLVAYNLS